MVNTENNPLVSVVVITYNSSEYVVETLDSIYNQTYRNIELIITDDCSTDNTVELCNQWLLHHQNRFMKSRVVASTINSGISANCNRGYKMAEGEWIKGIAGDDVLLPNCIERNMDYVTKKTQAVIVISKVETFSKDNTDTEIYPTKTQEEFYSLTAEEQFEVLLHYNQAYAPTLFIKKDLMEEIGYFDEEIPFIEDWPIYIKIFKTGFHLDYLKEVTVKYRVEESITRRNKQFMSLRYYNSLERFYQKYIFPIYKEKKKYISYYSKIIYLLQYKTAITILKNNKTKMSCCIFKLFDFINPETYLKKVLKNRLKYKFSY